MNPGDSKLTDSLERALQASLRPVDPSADFTSALQARLATVVQVPYGGIHAGMARDRLPYPASLPLAASIVAALAIGWQLLDLRAVHRAEQAHAHTQLLLALEITGEQLGQAQRRIEQSQLQEQSL